MLSKIKDILGSIRFWVILLGWAAAYLAKVETDGYSFIGLLDAIALFLGSVATVGTIDSFATKFSAKK